MLSDKSWLAPLHEVASGRGDVRELRGVLYDPPRQIAATRRLVLLVARFAVQRHHAQRVLEEHVLEFAEREFREEHAAGADSPGELDARVGLSRQEHMFA